MPRVESHVPSTINWVDLVSTDLDAATAFDTGLFGWETHDMPMPGGGGTYRFFRLDGRDAAAGGTMLPEMADQGIPSHWNVWVAGDADQVVEKAAAAPPSAASRCWSTRPAGTSRSSPRPGPRPGRRVRGAGPGPGAAGNRGSG